MAVHIKNCYWTIQASARRIRRSKSSSASHTDILVSSCKYYTKYVVRGAFAHKGECLECGMPRNDELVNNHDNKTAAYIRKYYNIPADNKIILYAPTYRKGKRNEATVTIWMYAVS